MLKFVDKCVLSSALSNSEGTDKLTFGKRKADYSFTSFELRVSLLHTIWGKYSKINLLAKLGMLPTSNDYKTKK